MWEKSVTEYLAKVRKGYIIIYAFPKLNLIKHQTERIISSADGGNVPSEAESMRSRVSSHALPRARERAHQEVLSCFRLDGRTDAESDF